MPKHRIEEEPKSYGNPQFYKKWANHPNRQFLIRLFAYLKEEDLVSKKCLANDETRKTP